MATTPLDLIGQAAGIVAILGAVARIVQVYMRGRVSGAEGEQTRIASHWKRLEDLNDDLRADNDRLRKMLADRDVECDHLRKQRDECWEANERRMRGKRNGEATDSRG